MSYNVQTYFIKKNLLAILQVYIGFKEFVPAAAWKIVWVCAVGVSE